MEGKDGLRTPVVLIIFNRTDTTSRVFEAIRAARPKTLLIIADGPRPGRPDDAASCAATRALVETVDWDCKVLRNYASENLGMRRRFSTAFEWVFENVEEAIFLEHDTLPHPDFFAYCEQLLERYRDVPQVMWIGGSNLMGQRSGDASYFFNRINWVWGWATWKRAWQHYDIDVKGLPEFKQRKTVKAINPNRRVQNGFMALLDRAYRDEWDNWDVQATFTIWSHNGVAVHPNANLISNIGFGAQAANTTRADDPLSSLPLEALGAIVHPADITIDADIDTRFFDAHMQFARIIARVDRYRHVPFSRPAYRAFRWAKNHLLSR